VILDRHQRKSGGKIEDLGRGSTAMAGAVESILALQRVGDWQSRKRKLYARGRHPASRWERVIELSEDRRTYTEATVDPNIDARDLALADRTEWTATELAGATGYSEDACRSWLKTSARTEQIGQGGRGQTLRFRVIAVPELD
jgi:hypothetical protein